MSDPEAKPITEPQLIKEYSVSNKKAVSRLIHSVFEEENALYIFPNLVGSHFISEILEIDDEDENEQFIWATCPTEPSIRESLKPQQVYAVVSFSDAVKIQFTGANMQILPLGKIQALRLPMPNRVVRLQRRSHARLIADRELEELLTINDDVISTFELVDVSLGGCGISVPGTMKDYHVGLLINDATLNLKDGTKPIPVTLFVRNIYENEEDRVSICLGCSMKLTNKSDETRFQKFILHNEQRQRKARRNTY